MTTVQRVTSGCIQSDYESFNETLGPYQRRVRWGITLYLTLHSDRPRGVKQQKRKKKKDCPLRDQ